MDDGLINTVMQVEQRLKKEVHLEADLPSWERVMEKDPDIIRIIVDVIEEEKAKFGPASPQRSR